MRMILIAAVAASMLGGCQSIFGKEAQLDIRPIGGASSETSASLALEEGRQQLLRGEVASAIVSLQVASINEETAAAAHNALGVAYSRLGRGDLAERYFRQAVAGDPMEAKYAANLDRFYRSQEAALAKAAMQAKMDFARAEPVVAKEIADSVVQQRQIQAGPSTVRVSSAGNGAAVRRVSAREIAIRTIPARHSQPAADGRRPNSRYAAAPPIPVYPVRIALDR